MKVSFLIVGLIICATSVLAQDYVDILEVKYDYAVPSEFKGSQAKGDFNELSADLTIPIPINDKLALISGAQYENFWLTPYINQEQLDLQGLMIKAGASIKHSDKISGLYMFLPKFMGQKFTGDSYQTSGLAILSFHKSEYFSYKLGGYLSDEFFGLLVVPVFGLKYNKENWFVNLTLPISANINYQLHDNLSTGLHYRGIKKSYLLNDNSTDLYLEKSNNELGLYIQYHLKNIVLRVMGGSSILRNFRIFPVDQETDWTLSAIAFGDNREQLNTDFNNGLVLNFSIFYRVFVD